MGVLYQAKELNLITNVTWLVVNGSTTYQQIATSGAFSKLMHTHSQPLAVQVDSTSRFFSTRGGLHRSLSLTSFPLHQRWPGLLWSLLWEANG